MLALLAIALACLIALIIIRLRRRRAAAAEPTPPRKWRRSSKRDSYAGRAASGRHAVGGPAGYGDDLPAGRLDFSHFAVMRQDVQAPAASRPGRGNRHLADPAVDGPNVGGRGIPDPAEDEPDVRGVGVWDPAADRPGRWPPFGDPAMGEPGADGASPNGLPADRASGEPDADGGAPIVDEPPRRPRPEESGPGDNGTRKPSSGPPWGPAEKPPGEPPWAPTSAARAGEHGVLPQRRSPRQGDITDEPPSWPADEIQR